MSRRPGRLATGFGSGVSVRRIGPATAADLLDRWWNNYSGRGVGLRGGRWTYSGDRVVRFRLHDVRLVRDLTVSGRVRWDRYHKRVDVVLHVRGPRHSGVLRGHWDTRARDAQAILVGRFAGESVRLRFVAP